MRRFQGLILLSAIYSLLLAVSFILPIWITIPSGIFITYIIIRHKQADHRKKIDGIQTRLSNLKNEGLSLEGKVKGTEADVFYRMILTLLTDMERSLFKLVEKNIQLLSLKEIGRSIISSLDEKKLIESIFEYLIHGVGYKEIALILLRKKKNCLQAFISIEKSTRQVKRVLNLDFDDLEGAVYNSFVSGKPFLIKDVKMHPLISAAGEPVFPDSTMTSYICVPLIKSLEEICPAESEECPVQKMIRDKRATPKDLYLTKKECLSCQHIPLLGALIVTDGYRATPLTNIDQVTIETVGSLVSSNIENWLLYQELRQEEIFREKVIEGMINGVFVVDLQGNVTLANKVARQMSQFIQNRSTEVRIDELIVDAYSDEKDSPVFKVLRENTPLTFYEAYLKRADGIHIPIRMNISQLFGEDNNLLGAIIEFVDLSDIKRMEEEIRHLDRLAVLGRFTSAVAHEIRNPLTGIAAGIQYFDRDEHLNRDQRENISFILNEVDRLNRIITDLFKVAKPRNLLYQKVKLADIVERASKSVAEIIYNKGIDFKKDIGDNLPLIDVDADQIVQIMINLIKNSTEAVDDHGKIWIKGRLYEGGDPEVVREKDKNMVCIEIYDNGPGIESVDREKIFEPFFSRKKGGTGLGLFITHSIVHHHQGRITVLSEPGDGTKFRVYLPITRPGK